MLRKISENNVKMSNLYTSVLYDFISFKSSLDVHIYKLVLYAVEWGNKEAGSSDQNHNCKWYLSYVNSSS